MSKLGITRATATVELCTDMERVAEWERLVAELDAAKNKPQADMLNGNTEALRIAKEITAVEEATAASTVVFKIRALSRKRWAELQEAHPAREGDEQDAEYGVDVFPFINAVLAEPDAIVSVVNKATGEAVEFKGSDWPDTAAEISNGQWNEFARKVLVLNNGVVARPTSRAASLEMRRSETNSEQPDA